MVVSSEVGSRPARATLAEFKVYVLGMPSCQTFGKIDRA